MNRTQIALGSLLGALTIHAVFVACGNAPGMQTADAQTSACCTPAYEHSFALTIDRGHGPETPRAEYSRGGGSAQASLANNAAGFRLNGNADFYLSDGTHVNVSCTADVRADHTLAPSNESRCNANWPESSGDGGTVYRSASGLIDSVAVTTLDDTHVEWSVPSLTFTNGMASGGLSSVVFRTRSDAAHFTAAPQEFRR